MRARVFSGLGLLVPFASLSILIVTASGPGIPLGPEFSESSRSQIVLFTALGLVFATTGTYLVWKTRNLVGWVLLGVGLFLSLLWLALRADVEQLDSPELLIATWVGFAWVPALFLMAVFLPLLFPTGHPPSRRWRWVAVVGGIGVIGGLVATSVDVLTRPWDQVLGQGSFSWWLVQATLIVGIGGALASVVVRVRRANTIERQQVKWVSWALGVVALLIALSLTGLGGAVLSNNPAAQNLLLLSFALIPISIVIAVSRYRLYAIDRIISRTVSYTLIVALLVVVFTGTVLTLSQIAPSPDSDLAVAVSTLVVAALFNPVRQRIQRMVDRKFNRAMVDRERELERLVIRIRRLADTDTIGEVTLDLINRMFEPRSSTLWTRSEEHIGPLR